MKTIQRNFHQIEIYLCNLKCSVTGGYIYKGEMN